MKISVKETRRTLPKPMKRLLKGHSYKEEKNTSLSTSKSFREGGVRSALQDRKAKPKLEKKADFVG